MLDKKYANMAGSVNSIDVLIRRYGLSLVELYEASKLGLSTVPNPCDFPGDGNYFKEAIERLKKDLEGIVLESDKQMTNIMGNIVSKYGLTNEKQLGDKIMEGINALDILATIINIINGNLPVQITDNQSLVVYINEFAKNMAAMNSNALFVNYNAIANENAMLKARIAELEQQQR